MYFDEITDDYKALATKLYAAVDAFDLEKHGQLPTNIVYSAAATLMLEAAVNMFPDKAAFIENMEKAWDIALGKSQTRPGVVLN